MRNENGIYEKCGINAILKILKIPYKHEFSLFCADENETERMGFKRPLVRFQSLGPKWGKPLKLLGFDGFFFFLFSLILSFQRA